jgi:hypothetical protein
MQKSYHIPALGLGFAFVSMVAALRLPEAALYPSTSPERGATLLRSIESSRAITRSIYLDRPFRWIFCSPESGKSCSIVAKISSCEAPERTTEMKRSSESWSLCLRNSSSLLVLDR